MPNFENVLYVADLKANLISTSQLCYDDCKVNFSKEMCMVVDKSSETVMKSQHISDNCYGIISQDKSRVCNSTIVNNTNFANDT